MMDDVKIYGLCLGRLKHQLSIAIKMNCGAQAMEGRILLESYNTADIDDLLDILEIYDIEERTWNGLINKLDDLAQTVSALMRETFKFDITAEGHLGLFLVITAGANCCPAENVSGENYEI